MSKSPRTFRSDLMAMIKRNPLKYVDERISRMTADDIKTLFRSLANTDGISDE